MGLPKGGILAFDSKKGDRKKEPESDPRQDAAEALMSALKSGNARKFLSALDSVMDLRDGDDLSLDGLEDDDLIE